MTLRVPAAVFVATALVLLGACGGSSHSVVARTSRTTATTARAVASSAPATVVVPTRARPVVSAAVAAALEQQITAIAGQLSVANSAIAQADVDAARQQEGNGP